MCHWLLICQGQLDEKRGFSYFHAQQNFARSGSRDPLPLAKALSPGAKFCLSTHIDWLRQSGLASPAQRDLLKSRFAHVVPRHNDHARFCLTKLRFGKMAESRSGIRSGVLNVSLELGRQPCLQE